VFQFLAEFLFNPSVAINRHQYRLFLCIYAVVLVPALTGLYLAVLILGFRSPSGFMHGNLNVKVIILSTVYVLLLSWPFLVASVKRMHDLGYSVRRNFFSWNPLDSLKIGRDLLMKIGKDKSDDLTRY